MNTTIEQIQMPTGSTVRATPNNDGTYTVVTVYISSGRTSTKTMTWGEWAEHCGWLRAEGARWIKA